MNWLWYLLEANLYLIIFYGFYVLFLQQQTFYSINRFYLLITSLFAFVLPILQVGFLKPTRVLEINVYPHGFDQPDVLNAAPTVAPAPGFELSDYLLPIYISLVLLFAMKLMWDIFTVLKLWFRAKKERVGRITIVSLTEETAFSFFNLLFVHPQLAQKKEVMTHEMVHIKQKHSVDILFFEILQMISWFNPVLYLIKKDIKLVHEYIADDYSTRHTGHKHEYAMLLIQHSFGPSPSHLANQFFNQSILKRRINMLNKKRTAGWARLRPLLVFPLAAGMLCTSTVAFTKEYGYLDLLPEKSSSFGQVLQEAPAKKRAEKAAKVREIRFLPPIIKNQHAYFPPFQYNKTTKKNEPMEVRQIVVNGKAVKDLSKFYGVQNARQIVFVSPQDTKKKYGILAPYGTIEITGNDVIILDEIIIPPPPIEKQKTPKQMRPTKAPGEVKVVELALLPTKKKKLDSVKVLELKLRPMADKKLDSVTILKVAPAKKDNKKAALILKNSDTSGHDLANVQNAKVSKAIQLEIKEARKRQEIQIVPQKKN